jgi:hypothetical protein
VCVAWSVTLREEHRLKVFENSVLRQILGPKRDELTVEWRNLHSDGTDGLYSFVLLTKYYSGDQIKKNEVCGACGTFGRQERCIEGFGWET